MHDLARDFTGPEGSLGQAWRSRTRWQVWLRWSVPPAIVAAVLMGTALGFELEQAPLLVTAAVILGYNIVFALALRSRASAGVRHAALERRYEVLQVALDYAAMLVLVHFTGGVTSPLLFFFVFHVIFAAVLFRARIAYLFATGASLGVSLLALVEYRGWLAPHPLRFRGVMADLVQRPGHVTATLLFFTASVFITAVATTIIMRRLRDRVASLAEATERVAALNDELEGLYAKRAQFMLQVAHNMRAPLDAAIGMLDAVLGGYLGELAPRQEDYVRRAARRLRATSETVGELLTLARTRRRAGAGEHVPLDLRGMAAELESTFSESASRKRLQLSVQVCDPPPAAGDPELVRQMLENLLSNAIKYTPAGGRVSVELRCSPEGDVLIEVRDNGIGIPLEEQPRLFTEFFRASNARRLEETGTGLGLAIVRETVQRHGGRIRVQSEPGAGTVFTVELPAAPRTPPRQPGAGAPPVCSR